MSREAYQWLRTLDNTANRSLTKKVQELVEKEALERGIVLSAAIQKKIPIQRMDHVRVPPLPPHYRSRPRVPITPVPRLKCRGCIRNKPHTCLYDSERFVPTLVREDGSLEFIERGLAQGISDWVSATAEANAVRAGYGERLEGPIQGSSKGTRGI